MADQMIDTYFNQGRPITLCPLLLTWINFNHTMDAESNSLKFRMKLFIRYQISMVQSYVWE